MKDLLSFASAHSQRRRPGPRLYQSEPDEREGKLFYLRYIAAELRRRRGRTIFTALGLGVGVGLVVTVSALSNGLDDAQSKVLKPLTGVGTDMTVNRPIVVSGSGQNQTFGPGQGLSEKEQSELKRENGGGRFDLNKLGKAGSHFDTTRFMTTNLSFSAQEEKRIDAIDGVAGSSGGLTLNMIHLAGTVPKSTSQPGFGGPPGGGAVAGGSFNFAPTSISGVDTSNSSLGLITPSQVIKGRYLGGEEAKQAVLSQTYADQQNLSVGDHIKVGEERFKVVGIAQAPLGGTSSDVYVPLKILQRLSDHKGRINALQVRATSADQVSSVAAQIKRTFNGSQVTTAQDLASRVSGSLVDAKNLSSSLGTALAIVALGAAFLIASLLTLSSVNKRTREIGTLKAVGWRQWLVVRQISGESVANGLIGGIVGAVLGVGGALLIDALGFTLKATVTSQSSGFGPFGGGPPGGGPFGQGQVTAGASSIALNAPIDLGILFLAVALAVLGGLIAGAVGGSRAARLRPAEALRSVE